jgi:hypothetical protein
MHARRTSSKQSRGLPLTTQNRLLRDLEDSATRHLKCHDLCNRRPEIYGQPGSSLRRSTQNKFHWFKKLKDEDLIEYWKLHAKAGIPEQELGSESEESGQESVVSEDEKELSASNKLVDSAAQELTPSLQSQAKSYSHLWSLPQEKSPSHSSTAQAKNMSLTPKAKRGFTLSSPQPDFHFDSYSEAEEYGKLMRNLQFGVLFLFLLLTWPFHSFLS